MKVIRPQFEGDAPMGDVFLAAKVAGLPAGQIGQLRRWARFSAGVLY